MLDRSLLWRFVMCVVECLCILDFYPQYTSSTLHSKLWQPKMSSDIKKITFERWNCLWLRKLISLADLNSVGIQIFMKQNSVGHFFSSSWVLSSNKYNQNILSYYNSDICWILNMTSSSLASSGTLAEQEICLWGKVPIC